MWYRSNVTRITPAGPTVCHLIYSCIGYYHSITRWAGAIPQLQLLQMYRYFQYKFNPYISFFFRAHRQTNLLTSLLSPSVALRECLLQKTKGSTYPTRERIKFCWTQHCLPSVSTKPTCDLKTLVRNVKRNVKPGLSFLVPPKRTMKKPNLTFKSDVAGVENLKQGLLQQSAQKMMGRPKRWQYSDPLQACITTNCQGLRKVPFYQCAYKRCIAEEEEE